MVHLSREPTELTNIISSDKISGNHLASYVTIPTLAPDFSKPCLHHLGVVNSTWSVVEGPTTYAFFGVDDPPQHTSYRLGHEVLYVLYVQYFMARQSRGSSAPYILYFSFWDKVSSNTFIYDSTIVPCISISDIYIFTVTGVVWVQWISCTFTCFLCSVLSVSLLLFLLCCAYVSINYLLSLFTYDRITILWNTCFITCKSEINKDILYCAIMTSVVLRSLGCSH